MDDTLLHLQVKGNVGIDAEAEEYGRFPVFHYAFDHVAWTKEFFIGPHLTLLEL